MQSFRFVIIYIVCVTFDIELSENRSQVHNSIWMDAIIFFVAELWRLIVCRSSLKTIVAGRLEVRTRGHTANACLIWQ